MSRRIRVFSFLGILKPPLALFYLALEVYTIFSAVSVYAEYLLRQPAALLALSYFGLIILASDLIFSTMHEPEPLQVGHVPIPQ